MRLIDLVQGSKEWKEFRRKGIGASDASVIMGLNPWKTPRQLWEQKINGTEDETNYAMQRGTDLEPIARDLYNKKTGLIFTPGVAVNDEYEWQFASMDGLDACNMTAIEIKCGGADLHEKASFGIVPEYYNAQLQHQMEVCNLMHITYVSYDGKTMHEILVDRDQKFIDKMLKAEEDFYECMITKTPPDLTDRDYVQFKHERASDLLSEYRDISAQEKALKIRKDAIKDEIVDIGPQRSFILDGIKIYQSSNTSYDYKKMKEDGIDFTSYKKTSKPFWMIAAR